MIKKTKAVRFRELYSVVDELLKSYSYEAVIEILEKEHNLKIAPGTFRSYLFRFKPDPISEAKIADQNNKVIVTGKVADNTDTLIDKSLSTENSSLLENKEKPEPPQRKMSADEALAQFKERQANKSLFDKK